MAALRETDPALEVTYRDLADEPLVHLTPAALPNDHPLAALATAHDPAAQAVSARVLEEFVAADVVVLGVPMYNFTIPSQVKAWFDRLPVPGKTFTYGEQGAVGLAGAKRVIIALSRGGFYGAGMPNAKKDHVEPVLRTVFGLMGITNLEFIVAEGVRISPELAEKALAEALAAARELTAA